jgi:endo-1,4-beta-xylanase
MQKILYIIVIAGLLFSVLSCNEPVKEFIPEPWDTYSPLHEVYGEFLLGNIVSPSDLGGVRFNILKRHYNIITAENHMKPDQIAPASNPGSVSVVWNYQYYNADRIVNEAEQAGLKVHGHTLIWHSQSPTWLAAGGETYLNKFVTDVVTKYKGRILSWDVVNEAFRDGLTASDVAGNNWKNCLRRDNTASGGQENGSPWNRTIGPEYIEKAFLAARAADPDAQLYYNDYNLNANSGNNKHKAVYNMVNDINTRYPNVEGRPLIDGVGMQSHHHLNTTPESVEESIRLFTSLDGVKVGITELDIQAAGQSWGEWGDGNAQKQAAKYAAFFRIFKYYSSDITRVTFWGLDDGTSWRGGRRNDGNPNAYPTLLDKDYNIKPAFHAVMSPDRY